MLRIFFVLTLFLSATSLSAQTSTPVVDSGEISDTLSVPISPNYVIRVDRLTVGDMQLDDTLDVVLESFGASFAGFVLKLGAASPYLDILEILPGEIPDSCGWEMFLPRQLTDREQDGVPLDIWQVSGLAKTTPDDRRPKCIGFDRPASLLRLVVSNAHVIQVPDTTAPIFFLWEDCRDNVLSDSLGNRLVMSASVMDYYPVAPEFQTDGFPTRLGSPSQCIKPNVTNPPTRKIDFVNGGVEFKMNMLQPLETASDSADGQ